MSYVHNLIKDIAILNLLGDTTGTAAATTGSPGVVDMQGFIGCTFFAISATTSWGTAQDFFVTEGATTSAFVTLAAGGATVAGAAADSTSRSILVIDVFRPKDRYLQVGFTTGTAGDVEMVLAIPYGPSKSPTVPSTATPVYECLLPADVVYVATPST